MMVQSFWNQYTIQETSLGHLVHKKQAGNWQQEILILLNKYLAEGYFVHLSQESTLLLRTRLIELSPSIVNPGTIKVATEVLQLDGRNSLLAPLYEKTGSLEEKALLLTMLSHVCEEDQEDACKSVALLVDQIGWRDRQGELFYWLGRIPHQVRNEIIQGAAPLLRGYQQIQDVGDMIEKISYMNPDERRRLWSAIKREGKEDFTPKQLAALQMVAQKNFRQLEFFIPLIETEGEYPELVVYEFLATPLARREEIVRIILPILPLPQTFSIGKMLTFVRLEDIAEHKEVFQEIKRNPQLGNMTEDQKIRLLTRHAVLGPLSYRRMMDRLELSYDNETAFEMTQKIAQNLYKLAALGKWFDIPEEDPLIQKLNNVFIFTYGITSGSKHPVRIYKQLIGMNKTVFRPSTATAVCQIGNIKLFVQWNWDKAQKVFQEKTTARSLTNREFFEWLGKDVRELLSALPQDRPLVTRFVAKFLNSSVDLDAPVNPTTFQLGVVIKNETGWASLLGWCLDTCESGAISNLNVTYAQVLANSPTFVIPGAQGDVRTGKEALLYDFIWNHRASWLTQILSGTRGKFLQSATGAEGSVEQSTHQAMWVQNALSKAVGNFLWPEVRFDISTDVLYNDLISCSQDDLITIFARTAPIADFVEYLMGFEIGTLFTEMQAIFDSLKLSHEESFTLDEEDRPKLTKYAAYKLLAYHDVINISDELRIAPKRSRKK